MDIKIRVEPSKPIINLKMKDSIVVYRAGEPQIKEVEYVENGEYSVEPDAKCDLEEVKIKVNVPIPEGYLKPEGTLDITENGEVDVTDFKKANVNVKFENPLNEYLLGTKTKITKEDLEGLTEIRYGMFYYAPITEVEFPSTVTILRQRCFMNTSLTSVNLEGITEIGEYAFSFAPIKELVLPSSIKKYGQRCFERCEQLEKVTIESQTGLPPHMFQYDTSLKRVICLLETPPAIYADQFKQFTGGETIEVRADLVETYKTATNWSVYADYIVAYEGD